ncbi:hypothetical protein C8K36_1011271 [Rhodococcus sp. OK519]|uniref:hypothetical protein n=1 Tax=Rhodococcus sp. OK519 TaxID=2135729 RepID=UPI000D3CE444|nr:hypothetical protein C8K36_1011271 [Rhodococcus sp. OK519]
MTAQRWPAVAAAVALAATVLVLGVMNPVAPARVSTDRLGPDSGEQVSEYLDRAGISLQVGRGDDPAAGVEHWALLALDAPTTASGLVAVAGDLRIAQVLFKVPIERVQTPIVAVGVGADPAATERASAVASARLSAAVGGGDRQSQIMGYSAAQLSGGCACVVGAVVRGSLDQLRGLVEAPGVRAVEALPSDAVAGAFAVSPLLPEQSTVVGPGPDDGPVPPLQ